MNRIERCAKFCTKKQDIIDCIDDMAYYGFVSIIKDNNDVSAVTNGFTFTVEYKNADDEETTLKCNHIFMQEYASDIKFDNANYDADLLLKEFGGIYLHL